MLNLLLKDLYKFKWYLNSDRLCYGIVTKYDCFDLYGYKKKSCGFYEDIADFLNITVNELYYLDSEIDLDDEYNIIYTKEYVANKIINLQKKKAYELLFGKIVVKNINWENGDDLAGIDSFIKLGPGYHCKRLWTLSRD
jgi:DNA polymerase sigma